MVYGLLAVIVMVFTIPQMAKHGLKVILQAIPSILYTTPMVYGLLVVRVVFTILQMAKHGLKVISQEVQFVLYITPTVYGLLVVGQVSA